MGNREPGGASVLGMMFMLWTLLIFSRASCFEVTETQEETDNITTLYPITVKNDTSRSASQAKTNDSVKTETSFTETLTKDEGPKKTESKEESVIEKPGNNSKEFKPSVHLGNFFDEDSFGTVSLPTKPTLDAFSPWKKPPSAFFGSHKDEFKLTHTPKTHERFPYRYESPILTRAKSKWRPTGLESKPTSAVPVQVPAGGLYNKPGAFRDKPGDDDEDFELEFNDDSEKLVKKRPNPWKGILHLLTAFIPVGLIISALTPSIITVHDTGNTGMPPGPLPGTAGVNDIVPPRLFRRSSGGLAHQPPVLPPPLPPPPAVSEPCRRRLLCELHSEKNYHDQRAFRRGRACHKLPCEEPEALAQALRWLLERRPPERELF